MSKKIIAVNAGPRKGWNTDTLITEVPWQTLPERYGKWQAVYTRYRQWKQLGIFEAIFAALSADADMEKLSIDSTSGSSQGLR